MQIDEIGSEPSHSKAHRHAGDLAATAGIPLADPKQPHYAGRELPATIDPSLAYSPLFSGLDTMYLDRNYLPGITNRWLGCLPNLPGLIWLKLKPARPRFCYCGGSSGRLLRL
jgi:hypothetical protein